MMHHFLIYSFLAFAVTTLVVSARECEDMWRTHEERLGQVEMLLQTLQHDNNDNNDNSDVYLVLGCFLDYIHFVCPVGKTISVTNATYGFHSNCSDACCDPEIYDCTGVVSEERPADWSALILSCNNRTTCAFQYKGGPVGHCLEQDVADYMMVEYECLPNSQSSEDTIAFTAIPTAGRNYSFGETVLFEKTLNNEGGHYDESSSMFTCPIDGTYSFTLTVLTRDNKEIHASITYDGKWMATVYAISISNNMEQSSVTANLNCEQGKTVHVEISYGSNNYLHQDPYDSYRFSLFSGFLV